MGIELPIQPVPRKITRADLRAVWLVRSRAVWSDLGFWLVLIGYNPRQRKISNPLYFVYAVLFFALWVFIVLTLLADYAARFLVGLPFASPQGAAIGVGVLAALALFLYELFRATQRSPFVFSDADAHLLVLTPVDRRPVALFWLLTAWLERGLGVWAGAVVIGYALLQAQFPRAMTPADLPVYLFAGARMFIIAVPLYLALLSLAWAIGAWRLRGAREPANLRWIAPVAALLLAGLAYLISPGVLVFWFVPLTNPVAAGLGLSPWGIGFGVALIEAGLALGALWWAARRMSLTRAAQETRDREAIQAARLSWRFDLAEDLEQKQRLRTGHPPSRLPARPGRGALAWKGVVQFTRDLRLTDALTWLSLFGLALGLLALPNWGVRAWGILFWVLLASGWMITPLRRELARWWIFRQLPFASQNSISSLLALPVATIWLAGLLALGAALLLRIPVTWAAIALYLVSAPIVGLAAAIDVLRRSKSQDLLVGRVPDLTILSVLLGLLLLGLVGGAAFLFIRAALPAEIGLVFLVGFGLLVLYLEWQAAGGLLRRVT